MIFFLPYILAGLAVVAGVAGNWWLDVTDWQTAAIFGGALIACVFVAQTNSPFARLATVAIIGAALYLKGGIDKEDTLKHVHAAEKAALHAAYAKVAKDELDRQAKANEEAQQRAAADKEQYDADLKAVRAQLAKLREQSAADPLAETPSLGIDAVRRLNSLRRVRPAAGS